MYFNVVVFFLDGTIKKIVFLLLRMITINSLKDRIAQREK